MQLRMTLKEPMPNSTPLTTAESVSDAAPPERIPASALDVAARLVGVVQGMLPCAGSF